MKNPDKIFVKRRMAIFACLTAGERSSIRKSGQRHLRRLEDGYGEDRESVSRRRRDRPGKTVARAVGPKRRCRLKVVLPPLPFEEFRDLPHVLGATPPADEEGVVSFDDEGIPDAAQADQFPRA